MPAVSYPITIEAGASWSLSTQYRAPALAGQDPASGAVVDLTGWTAVLAVRTKEPDPILQLTDTDGITIDDVTGEITVNMTSVQTLTLPFKAYTDAPDPTPSCHYTLSISDNTGEVIYLITGPVVVLGP